MFKISVYGSTVEMIRSFPSPGSTCSGPGVISGGPTDSGTLSTEVGSL